MSFWKVGEADKALSKNTSARKQPEVEETASYMIEALKPEPTVQKLFRLRWDIACALKLGAAQRVGQDRKASDRNRHRSAAIKEALQSIMLDSYLTL